jgi:large subunit ribosomal protein L1
MGSTKVATVDMASDIDADAKAMKKFKTEEKKREKVDIQEKIEGKIADNVAEGKDLPRPMAKARSKSYITARRNVDRTKFYDLKKAIELLKKSSYARFDGTVSCDLVLKDAFQTEISFPHSTGKTVRVAIADDALLKMIEKGVLDFDVLVASPDMMGKLAKHARVLGPKGLMPNPKNKTVTQDPQKRAKELEKGVTQLKTEKKAPLMHVVVGKTKQADTELIGNIEALLKKVNAKKVKKLVIASTMSPGIKIDLNPYQAT